MTFDPQPVEWICSNCTWVNTSGPSITRLPDGGEQWQLICFNCYSKYPVAIITARGVRLRIRLQNAGISVSKRRKLLEELQSEITRPRQ